MACTGAPSTCSGYGGDDYLCLACGCSFDYEFNFCFGVGSPCTTFGDISECEDCGCDWVLPGINIKVNINDIWKDAIEMKINIGDSWKTVTKIQINIGDVWKTVYQA